MMIINLYPSRSLRPLLGYFSGKESNNSKKSISIYDVSFSTERRLERSNDLSGWQRVMSGRKITAQE